MLRAQLTANVLIKENINAMLKARGQSRRELARWCRRTEAWLSQIFTKDDRSIPLKYLDRIADFFGIATYQLFQPGISPLTERRRAGSDRRKGRDRRLSAAIPVSQRPGDVDLMDVIRALSRSGREKAIAELMKILDEELRPRPAIPTSVGGRSRTDESAAPVRVRGRGKGQEKN